MEVNKAFESFNHGDFSSFGVGLGKAIRLAVGDDSEVKFIE